MDSFRLNSRSHPNEQHIDLKQNFASQAVLFEQVKDHESFSGRALHGFGEQGSAFFVFQNDHLHKNKLRVCQHLWSTVQNVQLGPLNI